MTEKPVAVAADYSSRPVTISEVVMTISILGGDVFLSLPGKHYKARRYLGYIEGDTFHCFRDPKKHLFRKMNAYGFCYEHVRGGKFLRVVVHLTDGSQLVTTRQRILQLGEILNYGSHFLERQIFLRVELFGDDEDIPESTDVEPLPPKTPPAESPFPGDDDVPPEQPNPLKDEWV